MKGIVRPGDAARIFARILEKTLCKCRFLLQVERDSAEFMVLDWVFLQQSWQSARNVDQWTWSKSKYKSFSTCA